MKFEEKIKKPSLCFVSGTSVGATITEVKKTAGWAHTNKQLTDIFYGQEEKRNFLNWRGKTQ